MHSQQNSAFQQRQKFHFARLFPELEPLYVGEQDLWSLAECMIDWGGSRNPDSTTITNGVAIFSQFLAHDITFEHHSTFQGVSEISTFQNDRTTNLDLDCLYGQRTQDFLYDAGDTDKLLLGKTFNWNGKSWRDLQRNSQQKAIIPDARNDENIIVSRMQVLFLQFHNCMVDHLRRQGRKGSVFSEARKLAIWHYQWLILHEYLYPMLDREIYTRLLQDGPRFYTRPRILPLEFTGAAFRVGHSQTRDVNRINENTQKKLFELGFFREMTEYIDWRYLFDFRDGKVEYARRIDTKIGHTFHDVPFIKSNNARERSLPFRNLRRGVIYGLPAGEAVAMRLGYEPLEVPQTKRLGLPGTPLWFYILYEAETLGNQGEHLGPVGSTILGECFLTIMQHDDLSYLKVYPRWQPEIGRENGRFDFADLVCFTERN